MNQFRLNALLYLHDLWLNSEGKDGKQLKLNNKNLGDVDFSNRNLSGSNLSRSDLSGSNLTYLKGNNKEIKNLNGLKWEVVYTKDNLAIGCQQHTFTEWENFTNEEISRMDITALEFWKTNREMLLNLNKI